VSGHLLTKLKGEQRQKGFEGVTGVICLRTKMPDPDSVDEILVQNRDFYESQITIPESSEAKRLITPLRVIEVINIKVVAGVVLIRYRLAQFFDYRAGDDIQGVRQARQKFNELIYASAPIISGDRANEEGDTYHVFETDAYDIVARPSKPITINDDEFRDEDGSYSLSWRMIVALLHFQPYLTNVPFALYCGLRPQNSPSALFKFEKWLSKRHFFKSLFGDEIEQELRDTSKIVFEENYTYELKIFESYPQEMVRQIDRKERIPRGGGFKHDRTYTMELDQNFFSETRVQKAIGGYDFLEFAIQVRRGTAGTMGSLHLHIGDFIPDGKKFISDQIDLEYQIATGFTRFWGLVGAAFLVSLAVATAFSFQDAFTSFGGKLFSTIITDVIYVLGVVGVVQYLVKSR